ncbi:hypothetical protein J7T55_008001 [Diaporthe amygdali]|uniref:uncharacterized protein n=1 Tax=Phomopsis amygdali TaxID=1214568 RepID=UPI0022FE8B9E|nr:uncharacterized protein J7T55_008001 [Diaporthe amygdali]KAJ0114166.1 hypothetical protein J7T55_008001 [Diaporthe amygdali]
MTSNADAPGAAPKDDYVLTRDFLDNNRINLLHCLWVKIFGYVTHPKIPIQSANLRVADVGTGTGIWLLDVRELAAPTARLEGFDISFDAVPPAETLPSNVKFRHWDVKQDLPEDLVGAFDIVHLRSLSFVLLNSQVPNVVERLFKMLKPGGYLQWGEPDFKSVRTDKTRPENKTEHLSELFNLLSVEDLRTRPTWLTDLPVTLSTAGFVQVEVEKIDPPPHMAFILHEGGLMMYEIFGRKTKNEKIRQEITRLLPLAVEESRQGAYTTATRWTVIGKKPEV